ncbi:unnamed protein product [Rotaria socialis]|uniref:Uncharacterized protein n=3 Tax=Rotaria socialis TaxID=392032 RepID=A0A818D8C6_9BILA|nr:unnamed protein product [Rotaria socialis]CAF4089840.1 unnamed protein product [Rotaria socialis]CAF4345195.1 unnamed protein product [Rotaria socialis]
MDYLRSMASSPVYEFPYTGNQLQSVPLFNNDISALLSNITPTLGNQSTFQPGSITLNCVPQINATVVDRNPVVYEVPENVPMETILNHFGVDVYSLKRTDSISNYYRCQSNPMEITITSPSCRRRRLVCREVTDSEDDNYDRRPLPHPRNYPKLDLNRPKEPPVALHDLLSNVWSKAKRGSESLPRSASDPNISQQWEAMKNSSLPPSNPNLNNVWQAMRNSPPPPLPNNPSLNNAWQTMRNSPPPPNNPSLNNAWQAMRNSPPPSSNPNINNAWQAMRNATPPMTQQERNAVNNVWQSANFESTQKSNRLANIFRKMQVTPGTVIQPSPWIPPNNPAIRNVWNQANLASASMPNNPWNPMPSQRPISPPPPPPPFYPSQPAANLAWNRMLQGANSSPSSPLPYPSMGALQHSPNRAPAPSSFASVLSQAQRQHSPYVGTW